MTYRKLVLVLALVLAPGGALARDRGAYRYCVLPNNATNRAKVSTCISNGRCLETSLQTVRRSLDGTQGLVKWRVRLGQTGDDIPTAVSNTCTLILTHAQARALMRTAEWSEQ